jgi:hypothetical protein
MKKLCCALMFLLLPQIGTADPPKKQAKPVVKLVKVPRPIKHNAKARHMQFRDEESGMITAVAQVPAEVTPTAVRVPDHKTLIRAKGDFKDALLRSGGAQ